MTFHITFSRRYLFEPHPIHSAVNPAGYVTVQAQSFEEAHLLANRVFGAYYSTCTPTDKFNSELYPQGELWKLN